VRKTVLYTLMSLDGDVDDPARYFTTSLEPGRPPEFDSVMHDNLARVIGAQDAVLLGRHMFDEWSQYWPTSGGSPSCRTTRTASRLSTRSASPDRPSREVSPQRAAAVQAPKGIVAPARARHRPANP
jgi:dihydrofolate reductase